MGRNSTIIAQRIRHHAPVRKDDFVFLSTISHTVHVALIDIKENNDYLQSSDSKDDCSS